MFDFMTTAEGGLTAAGYSVSLAVMILVFLAAVCITGKKHLENSSGKFSAQKLTFCAMGIALAFAASYIRLLHFPYGGSVTLCSMLFIVLIADWYGVRTGVLTGFAYGMLQFLQEPYVLTLFQVCCDYLFAFAALGLAGFFRRSRNGLLKGYLLAVLVRGFFHSLGGYLFWMDTIPADFPSSIRFLYPVIYNYSFLLTEGVLTVLVISLPPVRKALDYVRTMAVR